MKRERVLLIEDNGSLAKLIVNELEEKGYCATRAYSYDSALDAWDMRKGEFDAIIMDLQIDPEGIELDVIEDYGNFYGLAVVEYIKQKEGDLNKIVIYSAYADSLRDRVRRGEYSYAKNIKLVSKGRDSIELLLKAVDKIIRERGE